MRRLRRRTLRVLHSAVPIGRLRLPIDTFILLLLATVGFALLVPAQGVAAGIVDTTTKFAIALLFLLYGVRLSPAEAWQGLRHWRLHLMVLSVTFVVFPLLGLATRALVPTVLTADLYSGVLFLCLVPSTVQSSIAFTSIARGNVSAAVVSATLSNMLGVVVSPLLVVALMSTTGGVRFDGSAVLDIVLQLLAPFVAGKLLRPWLATWVHRHAVLTRVVDRGSILLVVYAAFSVGMAEHVFGSVTGWRIAAVAAVCTGLLAVVLGSHDGDGPRLPARSRRLRRPLVLRVQEEPGIGTADGAGAIRIGISGPDCVATDALSHDPADGVRGDRELDVTRAARRH